MSAPGEIRPVASLLPLADRERVRSRTARLFVYFVSLAISFVGYLLVHGAGHGPLFWTLALAVVIGGLCGMVLVQTGRSRWVLRASVMLAVAVAVTIPLVPRIAAHGGMAAAMAETVVWPQLLVALFGSRVLAELTELQFAELWEDPFAARQSATAQSITAALALGAFLALLFYQVGAMLGGRGATTSGVVLAALFGDSVVHYAIIVLFFAILAFVIDAALLHARDRSAVAATRSLVRQRRGMDAAALRRLLDSDLVAWSHTRAVRFMRDALDAGPGRAPSASSVALTSFHQASRRFIRGLIPFLPLLGFMGTVIGLSIALAELPHGLAPGQREGFDISGSLSGLAVKFETTLLGLLGSMIVSLALGILEKSEAELAADCALLVGAAETAGAGDAP